MTAKHFRYFFIVSVVIAALLVGYGFAQIQESQRQQASLIVRIEKEATAQGDLAVRVAAITKSNLDNRVKNVGTWCGAINENRAEGIRKNQFVTGARRSRLKLLDCKALERATIQSGESIPIPAGVSK